MTPANVPGYTGTFNSANDNENQNEENYYSVLTYQKSAGDFDYQISAFGRESEQHFRPDPIGDLFLNGVASEVHRTLYSAGLQPTAVINWANPIPFGRADRFWPREIKTIRPPRSSTWTAPGTRRRP
jgi:hypothetical protein